MLSMTEDEKRTWIAEFFRIYGGDEAAAREIAESHMEAATAFGLGGDEAAYELMQEEVPCWME